MRRMISRIVGSVRDRLFQWHVQCAINRYEKEQDRVLELEVEEVKVRFLDSEYVWHVGDPINNVRRVERRRV